MTEGQKETWEALGLCLIAFGMALWLSSPWILIVYGVLFVIIGNTGRVNNGSSP